MYAGNVTIQKARVELTCQAPDLSLDYGEPGRPSCVQQERKIWKGDVYYRVSFKMKGRNVRFYRVYCGPACFGLANLQRFSRTFKVTEKTVRRKKYELQMGRPPTVARALTDAQVSRRRSLTVRISQLRKEFNATDKVERKVVLLERIQKLILEVNSQGVPASRRLVTEFFPEGLPDGNVSAGETEAAGVGSNVAGD